MKKTISIRPRQPSDIPILSNLRSVHKNSGYPVEGVANPESFITPPNQLKAWVALTDDGNIVGHIAVMPTDPHSLAAKVSTGDISKTASLGRLFVDPEVRGEGFGTSLVAVAGDWARAEGVRLLLVVLEKDGVARRMYERLGWDL